MTLKAFSGPATAAMVYGKEGTKGTAEIAKIPDVATVEDAE